MTDFNILQQQGIKRFKFRKGGYTEDLWVSQGYLTLKNFTDSNLYWDWTDGKCYIIVYGYDNQEILLVTREPYLDLVFPPVYKENK